MSCPTGVCFSFWADRSAELISNYGNSYNLLVYVCPRVKFKQEVEWIAIFLAHLNFPRMRNSKQVNPTPK